MAYTLNQLYTKRNQTQRQINQLDSTKNDLSRKIERLEDAKQRLQSIKKNETGPLKTDVKPKNVIGSMQWKGQYKDNFTALMDSDVKSGANSFHSNVDEMHDRVNNALAYYKDQYDAACGRQNALRSTLRWIGTQIQNFFN